MRRILLLALLLRVLWWSAFPLVISNEGSEYARLAQNLFRGAGYVGKYGGLNVNFPPLYPVCIGLLTLVVGSEEVAGRLISLASGIALVGVVYLTAGRLFDRRAAVVAGLMAACHPLLIATSVTVYSELLFMLLAFGGAYFALEAPIGPSIAAAAAAGTLFGLAYLTRPEGILYAITFSSLLVARALWSGAFLWKFVGRAAVLLAACAFVAAPYVAHISSLAGEFRLHGKFANAINARLALGLSYDEANRGLVEIEEPSGRRLALAIDESDQLRLLRQSTTTIRSQFRSVLSTSLEQLLPWFKSVAGSPSLGSPIVPLLAFLGVACAGWWQHSLWVGVGLLAMCGLQALVVMNVQYSRDRFLWPMAPLLVIWGAGGLRHLTGLMVRSSPKAANQESVSWIEYLAIALIAVIALRATMSSGDVSTERDAAAREAGLWIREDFARVSFPDRRPLIVALSRSGVLAHYANGDLKYPPYADESTVLQYLQQVAPDYLVVREMDAAGDRTLAKWLTEGIEHPCAELARDPSTLTTESFKVWRWRCPH